jgi:hypothetical protein
MIIIKEKEIETKETGNRCSPRVFPHSFSQHVFGRPLGKK